MRASRNPVTHATLFALLFFGLGAGIARAEPPRLLFVLDASGSMWGAIGGQTKIEIARDVLRDEVVGKLDPAIPMGLLAYGHRNKGDCADIELVADIGTDRDGVLAAVDRLQPMGMTPLTASLERAREMAREYEGRTEIIVVSDGKETCGGDPCATARALRESGTDVRMQRVHVVGFDVTEEEERQLDCVAREGGGTYVRADDATELRDAVVSLSRVVVAPGLSPVRSATPAVQKIALSATGRLKIPNFTGTNPVVMCPVRDGQRSNDCIHRPTDALELPVGTHTLAWDRLRFPVEIQPGQDTELQLATLEIAGDWNGYFTVGTIDGNVRVGSVHKRRKTSTIQLPPGSYRFMWFQRPDVTFDVTLSAGEVRRLELGS